MKKSENKNQTQNQNKEKKSWLDDRKINVVLSLLIALVIWTYVTMVKDPNQFGYVSDVQVDFGYSSEIYSAKELDIVNNPEAKVTVRLSGSGPNINGIKKEDLIVYPDYTAVTGPGEIKLPLHVRFADSRKGRDVEAMTGETVTLVFDSVDEKTFDVMVELDTEKMSTADGYVLHGMTSSPQKVTVRGPKSELDRIDRIVAVVKPNSTEMENSLLELNESKLATAALEAWDENDKKIELKYSTMDNTMADVSINVYQIRELPLKVNFINVSPSFDLNNLKYSLSQETMIVTGKTSVVSDLTELAVSDFDLGSSFEMDKIYQLNVELPKGVGSKDNLTSVTLTFDTKGLASRTLNVPNLRVINQPTGVKITPNTNKLANVTLIGPEEELEKLSPASVVAVIDASAAQIDDGTENLSAQINIPASSTIFAVGGYSVECSVGTDGGQN